MENKKRLIDAYKLEDLVRSNSARYHHVDDVIAAIAGQPTVDAVEVVRCKDCKSCMFCYPEKQIDKEATPAWYCKLLKGSRRPDDFCSFGERREGE